MTDLFKPKVVEGVQQVRRMRGGSQSHLMRASDGNFYITKFLQNPQCKRVLANEFIASILGKALGLPMPEVVLIDVSEWLINHTEELHVECAGLRTPCVPGRHLGIRFVADPLQDFVFDYLLETLCRDRLANLADFSRCLMFDKWTGNVDGRQAVFTKKHGQRSYAATFIDQGYCFNAGEWNFPDLALQGVFYRNFVYEQVRGWDAFEPTLTRIEKLTPSVLRAITAHVPAEWWKKHEEDDSLQQLTCALSNRRFIIRDLIEAFRHSSRNPFPNWGGN